jgi:peptide/nickel transport system substrate-binding protein
MPSLRPSLLLCVVLLAGCNGAKDATPLASANAIGGTVVVSSPAEPDNLMPPITTTLSGLQVEDLVYEHLADVGASQNTVGDKDFTPSLARSWSWAADSLSIAFHLDSNAHWHDGKPVRAADVKFTLELYRDPKTAAPAATVLGNVDSVSVRDALTAVVWFKQRKPEQFFDITYQTYILPSHLLTGIDRTKLAASPLALAPIGSGPFRFVRWDAKQVLELSADTTAGRRRAQLDRVLFTIAPEPNTAFARVATGEADVFEAVRPDKVAEVTKNRQLRMLMSPGLDYNFLAFNYVDTKTGRPHRLFADPVVRRALTMATDRRSIVANVYDTLAVLSRGPFTAAQASADATAPMLPYSVDSANALLDAAGWVRGADSVRRRNGITLAFDMLVPTTSVARMRMAVLLQEQFRRVGAAVTVNQMDMGGFVERMTTRRFDTVLGSWHVDPSPGTVRDGWSIASAAKGGNNFGAYRSAAFDAQVDSGTAAFSPDDMRRHFSAAWRQIADDAPAIWLAELKQAMAVNARVSTTGMRPDAWWAGMESWTIPADKRIARDAPAATGTAH